MRQWIVTSLSLFFFTLTAIAAPESMMIEGKLIDSAGNPVEDSSVVFTLQVMSPPASDCVLYEEQHTLNMLGSNGNFNLTLGNGTRAGADYEDLAGNTLLKAFDNNLGTVNPTNCGGSPSYTPSATDQRYLRISFNPSAAGIETLADMEVGSSAFALSAGSIDGLSSTQLLQVNTGGGFVLDQTNLEWVFGNSARYAELQALLNGTSTQYNSGLPTAAVDNNGQLINNVATPVAGTDAANRNYVDNNLGGGAIDFATTSALNVGNSNEVLTWNGSQWTSSAIPSDISKLDLAGGTMAGAIDMGAQDIINANDIGVGNDLTVGNNVTVTGSVSANALGGNSIALYNGANYMGFQASPGSSDLLWTLPNTDGTSGQVLQTDGAGNLSWVAPGAAPVTSVYGRTGVVMAVAGDYTANQINNTPAGNIAAADVQAAIDELDSEKLAMTGDNMTGALTMNMENEVRFADNDDSHYVGFKAPTVITAGASFVWTLPTDDGTSGQVLQTDGAGNLSWVAPGAAPVTSVYGRTGVVMAVAGDYNAGQISFTPTGNIASVDAQAAIAELDAEKVDGARNLSAGSGLIGGGDLTADRTFDIGAGPGILVNADDIEIDIPSVSDFAATVAGVDTILMYDNSAATMLEIQRSAFVLSEAEVDAFAFNPLTANWDLGGTNTIINVPDPTAANDVANRNYVDNAIAGIGTPTSLADADADTLIQVEKFADEDTIRFDTNGIERMLIDTGGNVGIGTNAPVVALDVDLGTINAAQICDENNTNCIDLSVGVGNGDFLADGSVPMTGALSSAPGSVTSPGITFNGDQDTGLFNDGVGGIAFSSNGTEQMRLDGTGLLLGNMNLQGNSISTTGMEMIVHSDNDVVLHADSAANKVRFEIGASGEIAAAISDNAGSRKLAVYSFGSNQSKFIGYQANGTQASPTATSSTNILASFEGWGHDGASVQKGSEIRMVASDTWSTNIDSEIQFHTKDNGTQNLQMVIAANGYVGIGNPNPAATLDVNGSIAAGHIMGQTIKTQSSTCGAAGDLGRIYENAGEPSVCLNDYEGGAGFVGHKISKTCPNGWTWHGDPGDPTSLCLSPVQTAAPFSNAANNCKTAGGNQGRFCTRAQLTFARPDGALSDVMTNDLFYNGEHQGMLISGNTMLPIGSITNINLGSANHAYYCCID